MTSTKRFERADIILIIPLQEEFLALQRVFTFVQIPTDRSPSLLPTLFKLSGLKELRVIACILNVMANEHSSLVTERCIRFFDPTLVIGVGIAGSLDKSVRLGDVVVSRTVENVVFESKAVPRNGGGYRLLPSANGSMNIEDGLYQYLASYESTHAGDFQEWQLAGETSRLTLNLETMVTTSEAGKTSTEQVATSRPALVIGAIASGPSVGAATAYVDEVKQMGRDFRALEMEGAGIARACQKRELDPACAFLLVRGISDFSDERKALLEDSSKGGWRTLAAANAGRFVQTLIKDPAFLERTFRQHRHSNNPQLLRIAVVWNDTVHYVSAMDEGFRKELRARVENRFEVIFGTAVGSPEKDAAEANEVCIQNLVKQFGDEEPNYVVTIGTAVTIAAIQTLPRHFKLLFLGVSDPETLNLNQSKAGVQRPRAMGFRYGLPIAETISLIKEAFLGKTLVFVFSGDRYPQDTNLAAAIKVQHPDVVLLGLDMPKPLGLDPSAHVFFGRFFFCRNMGEFSRQNSQALLVGVTRQNLGFGACMAIGYEPEQIGQLGAERIEQDLTSVSWLKDGEILQPKTPVIAVNDRLMQRLKITLPEPFLQQHKVESYADI